MSRRVPPWATLRWLAAVAIWVTVAALLLTPGSPEPDAGLMIPDKLAHLLAWVGMTGSLYLALGPPSTRQTPRVRALVAVSVAVMWGVATELLQASIPRRSPDAADVLADAAGALIGVALAGLLEGALRWRARRRGLGDQAVS